MIPFLAIHAKGGESKSTKQKDRTTTYFKSFVFPRILNWFSYYVQKGEKIVFQNDISKPLLNTKRRISFRGSFTKSRKYFAKSYSFAFDYLQKNFEKDLQNSLQNMWCKRGPKCYK
jgi:hypothetical protein